MEFNRLLQTRREEILAAARRHGAYDVRIFGSVARGEARSDSDIDFLVKLEAGLRSRIRSQVLKEAQPL